MVSKTASGCAISVVALAVDCVGAAAAQVLVSAKINRAVATMIVN